MCFLESIILISLSWDCKYSECPLPALAFPALLGLSPRFLGSLERSDSVPRSRHHLFDAVATWNFSEIYKICWKKVHYVLKSLNPSKVCTCAWKYKCSSTWLIILFLSVILDYLCNPPPREVSLCRELLPKRFFRQDINSLKAQSKLFIV